MQFIDSCDGVKWVAYFDLLGIRQLLTEGKESSVFNAHWGARAEFREFREWAPELQQAWFSDTFVIVAPDDSGESLEMLEVMSRSFAIRSFRGMFPFEVQSLAVVSTPTLRSEYSLAAPSSRLTSSERVKIGLACSCARVPSNESPS